VIDFDNLPALLSVPAAAELLGLKRASAYRYAATGDLPTRRLGGRVYVVTAKLQAFIDGDADNSTEEAA
jgi:predicted DNA-binding transcriptional regulator AlpA